MARYARDPGDLHNALLARRKVNVAIAPKGDISRHMRAVTVAGVQGGRASVVTADGEMVEFETADLADPAKSRSSPISRAVGWFVDLLSLTR